MLDNIISLRNIYENVISKSKLQKRGIQVIFKLISRKQTYNAMVIKNAKRR